MSMNRHEPFEELMSASLSGDLSDAERQQLDAHIDSCADCRSTLAAFADQRRIMAGLRHIAPPRDLGARVRSGVEGRAFLDVPWWRRPVVIFGGLGGGLAAVAGALLAIVLLNGTPEEPQVGGVTELPSPSVSLMASASAVASPIASVPATSSTPTPSDPLATPVSTATAPPTEPEADPRPDVYLTYTGPFDNLQMTLRDGSGDTVRELAAPISGPPIAAELSPNGQFLAYITPVGESGMNELWLLHLGWNLPGPGADAERIQTPLGEWESLSLGQSLAGSPFLERMSWASDSQYLAYTLADPNEQAVDAWMFESSSAARSRLTDVGNAYAGSWVPETSGTPQLWVSTAGDLPMSHLVDPTVEGSGDPADSPITTAEGVFQPLLSPDGSKAIYWRGVMQLADGGPWSFSGGASPFLADAAPAEFTNERPLFGDVTIDQDAFVSAAIAWGADSDAYAVWNTEWSGLPQGAGGEYPSNRRVYFSHASDPRGMTEGQAIDVEDIPMDSSVVDVKVTTGRHLLVTASRPRGGIMEAPVADLFLIARNTGNVPDEVTPLRPEGQSGWFGPAAYDAFLEAPAP